MNIIEPRSKYGRIIAIDGLQKILDAFRGNASKSLASR